MNLNVVFKVLSDVSTFIVFICTLIITVKYLSGRIRYASVVSAIISYLVFVLYAFTAKYLILPSIGIECTEFINTIVKTAPYLIPIAIILILINTKLSRRYRY